jgi:two-component system heavy metal sensor histidine kinase CusS
MTMSSDGSIRFRLTAWYTAILLAGLGLFGIGTWIAVSISVTKAVDQSLRNRVDALKQFMATVPEDEVPEEVKEFAMGAPDGNLFLVRDSEGKDLLSSPFAAALARARPGFDEVIWGGRRYRVLSQVTFVVSGHRYQVAAGANLDERGYILDRFRVLLLLAIPSVLLIAALGGYWLSRRALRPVDEMTDAARSIGIDNLSRRLRVPRTGDELQRLAETWNDMLGRLEQSVKRLSQFTADASHELRSPIALIRTAAEIALRQARTPEAYRETLRRIHEESERTSHLVEDLLVLARADGGAAPLQLAPVDLAEVVDDVCRAEQRQARAKDLNLEVRVPEETVVIQGNDGAIRRLVRVLLDNAIKYTPAGGRIEVSLDPHKDSVELAVRDTGIGIAETDLPRVFDRFYRADKARSRDEGGCGLGLSIAQWIARCHRAEIHAESDAGRGSVFRVAFRQ